MSGHLTIHAATIAHVYDLARNLREEDRAELGDMDPRAAVRKCWRMSVIRRTALVDGEVAAMWGMAGPILASVGEIWLLTTPAIERAPVAFIRGAKSEIERMLAVRDKLTGVVCPTYRRATRFLEVLGFTIGQGVARADGTPPLSRFEMVA